MDDRLLVHRGVVAAAIGIDDGTTAEFQIGFAHNRTVQTIIRIGRHAIRQLRRRIVVVAIAATEELSDIDLLGIGSLLNLSFYCLCLGRDAHEGIPRVVNAVLCRFFQFGRNRGRTSDGASDIITAIYLINNNIVGGMLAIDVDKG